MLSPSGETVCESEVHERPCGANVPMERSLVSLRMAAFPLVSETTRPNRSSTIPAAADADDGAEALIPDGVALPEGVLEDALGAVVAAVHAIKPVARSASARGTS